MRLIEIAERLGGRLFGDGDLELRGVAHPDDAGPADISPVIGREIPQTSAGALLTTSRLGDHPQVVVAEIRAALRELLEQLRPRAEAKAGIDPRAAVDATAQIDDRASIGPFAVVGPRTRVGPNACVSGLAFVGADCVLDEGARVFPNAVVLDGCRIGAFARIAPGAIVGYDGFGFIETDGKPMPILSAGHVEIGPHVDVGANATIDRATLGATRIEAHAKLDDQVHVGHNSRIGAGAILCGQVGLAGSVTVGAGALLGGKVGVADHLGIGPGARVGAGSGVAQDIPAGETFSGYPAMPHRRWLRAMAHQRRTRD